MVSNSENSKLFALEPAYGDRVYFGHLLLLWRRRCDWSGKSINSIEACRALC
jgi:hypothetical protein